MSVAAVLKLRSGERPKTLLHSLGRVCSGKSENLSVIHNTSTYTGQMCMRSWEKTGKVFL